MTDTDTPRVWVGCLACYNSGRLVGDWVDAVDAEDVTPDDLHGGQTSHEELWVFDLENMPAGAGEMSPVEASKIGRGLVSVENVPAAAVRAYISNIGASYVDWDTLASDVEDVYCGLWDSFRDYAEELAEDIGLLSGAPETLASYFDWDKWTRDLAYDYWTSDYDTSAGGYHVFRNQ